MSEPEKQTKKPLLRQEEGLNKVLRKAQKSRYHGLATGHPMRRRQPAQSAPRKPATAPLTKEETTTRLLPAFDSLTFIGSARQTCPAHKKHGLTLLTESPPLFLRCACGAARQARKSGSQVSYRLLPKQSPPSSSPIRRIRLPPFRVSMRRSS